MIFGGNKEFSGTKMEKNEIEATSEREIQNSLLVQQLRFKHLLDVHVYMQLGQLVQNLGEKFRLEI